MLTAREFVEIDLKQPEKEQARLESIHQQIAEQTPEVKQRMVQDFLKIIKNPAEKLSTRHSACIILGGKRKDLGIIRSSHVVATLRDIINKEFIVQKRSGIFLKKEISLREMHVLEFSFLESLLITLLRIDFHKTRHFVETVTSKVNEPKWLADLKGLFSKIIEKEKLELQ
jgi:hypothetical protein